MQREMTILEKKAIAHRVKTQEPGMTLNSADDQIKLARMIQDEWHNMHEVNVGEAIEDYQDFQRRQHNMSIGLGSGKPLTR